MISLISLLSEFLSRLVSCASGSLVGEVAMSDRGEGDTGDWGGVNDGFGGLGRVGVHLVIGIMVVL